MPSTGMDPGVRPTHSPAPGNLTEAAGALPIDGLGAVLTHTTEIAVEVKRVFSALANSERLAIVDILVRVAPTCSGSSISEIAEAADLSRFSASRHLAILRGAGLVSGERSRSGFRHRVNVAALIAIEDWAYSRASRGET